LAKGRRTSGCVAGLVEKFSRDRWNEEQGRRSEKGRSNGQPGENLFRDFATVFLEIGTIGFDRQAKNSRAGRCLWRQRRPALRRRDAGDGLVRASRASEGRCRTTSRAVGGEELAAPSGAQCTWRRSNPKRGAATGQAQHRAGANAPSRGRNASKSRPFGCGRRIARSDTSTRAVNGKGEATLDESGALRGERSP